MEQVPRFRLQYLETFDTKEELIDACMASAHIPFFLDGRPGSSPSLLHRLQLHRLGGDPNVMRASVGNVASLVCTAV